MTATILTDERLPNGDRRIVVEIPVSHELLEGLDFLALKAEVERRMVDALHREMFGCTAEEWEQRVLYGDGTGAPIGIIRAGKQPERGAR